MRLKIRLAHTRACAQTHTHTYARTHAHTVTHADVRARAHARTHTHTHTRTHARTHARTPTHSCTHASTSLPGGFLLSSLALLTSVCRSGLQIIEGGGGGGGGGGCPPPPPSHLLAWRFFSLIYFFLFVPWLELWCSPYWWDFLHVWPFNCHTGNHNPTSDSGSGWRDKLSDCLDARGLGKHASTLTSGWGQLADRHWQL